MAEPLHEENEEEWIVTLNRFETEVWPLFERMGGYTKGEAHILWRLTGMQIELQDLNERMEREF